ncbi:hypothetical protein CONPUDRAFT_163773 [Coniophora puteana RWD-64-598 SS2]|uniref:Uncharacterized protein n=1 Tax=Coniophora puteana (strain RWD-64-598) TaxID=741705 RepID=A0A5M3MU72_CONPW|nr:uncharacterized protein CONPUDRAFT_163773 [Coniophora puteana RWD-64-598 SS2]EIW82679.1 hypothetical protein CONPUDRAFT_163773 [Coniophora puteana RWD-64-598 SS2]
MSAYDYYQHHTNGWGTNQMRFGPPQPIRFQPQPNWGGYDFFRAHANTTPDPNLWQHAFRRINSDSMNNSLGVGLREARSHHHRVFGGLASMHNLSPQELGHAAAYEAYRLWIHNSSLYEPLGADPHRQKEALVGLAVAEAMRLYNHSSQRMDSHGRYPAIEAAAATASMLFQDVIARESTGGMGRGRSPSPMGRGVSPGSPYAGAGYGGGSYGGAGVPAGAYASSYGGNAGGYGGYDGTGYPNATGTAGAYGGAGAGGSPYLKDAYHSDYDAPWFSGRHAHSPGSGYGSQRQRRHSHTGYGMGMGQPPSPIQMVGPYPRSPSPYNVPGAASQGVNAYPGRAPSPYNIAGASQGGYPGRAPSPYNVAGASQGAYPGRSPSPYNVAAPASPLMHSHSHSSHSGRSPSPYRSSGQSHEHSHSHSHRSHSHSRRSPSPMRALPIQPVQQAQVPMVLDSRGRPYKGANVYQATSGHTVIEIPSSSSKHKHHSSTSKSGHHHSSSRSGHHSSSSGGLFHRSRSSEPGPRVYRV